MNSICRAVARVVLLILILAKPPAVNAQSGLVSYTVDSAATVANWSIPFLGVTTLQGRFERTMGKVSLDRSNEKGSIEIAIDTASVNAGNRKFEEHLRGKDFFHVEQFPVMIFKGQISRFDGDSPAEVEGELTLLGVVRPVTLKIANFRCQAPTHLSRDVCAAQATTSIDRTQFGMTYGVGFSGRQVDLAIQIEASRD